MEHPESIDDITKLFPNRYKTPKIDPTCFLAPGSRVHGDVWMGRDSSLWFNSVVRGDVHSIRIGEKTNIQDLSVVHVSYKLAPVEIGSNVTIGHSTIIHGCTIADHVIIGMGSVILDQAEIGEDVILGAGSLVTQKMKIPPRSKAFGRPAKVVAELTEEEIRWIRLSAQHYVQLAKTYLGVDTRHCV